MLFEKAGGGQEVVVFLNGNDHFQYPRLEQQRIMKNEKSTGSELRRILHPWSKNNEK